MLCILNIPGPCFLILTSEYCNLRELTCTGKESLSGSVVPLLTKNEYCNQQIWAETNRRILWLTPTTYNYVVPMVTQNEHCNQRIRAETPPRLDQLPLVVVVLLPLPASCMGMHLTNMVTLFNFFFVKCSFSRQPHFAFIILSLHVRVTIGPKWSPMEGKEAQMKFISRCICNVRSFKSLTRSALLPRKFSGTL